MHWEIRIPLFAWELGTASLTSSPCTALISALARSEQALNFDVVSPERVFGDDCARRAVLASARTSSKAQPQTYISFLISIRIGLDGHSYTVAADAEAPTCRWQITWVPLHQAVLIVIVVVVAIDVSADAGGGISVA